MGRCRRSVATSNDRIAGTSRRGEGRNVFKRTEDDGDNGACEKERGDRRWVADVPVGHVDAGEGCVKEAHGDEEEEDFEREWVTCEFCELGCGAGAGAGLGAA